MKNFKQETLKNWQDQFLNSILEIDQQSLLKQASPITNLSIESCLNIYTRGYKARLIESLGQTFEATWWVLGDEDFFMLAEKFVVHNPSKSFDLSDYGIDFPTFLKTSSNFISIPFLSELAHFEWNFKTLFHSADTPKPEDFSNRLSQDLNLKLQLVPSVVLWKSDFAIYDIWKRRTGPITVLSDLNLNRKEYLLCRKLDGKVHITYLEEPEFFLLQKFTSPTSLDEALDSFQTRFSDLTIESIQNLFLRIGGLGVLTTNAVRK